MWNSQNYLFVSGNFGKVSLGFMNNFALTSALTSQPFGIGMGGGYSREFGRLNGTGVIGAPAVIAGAAKLLLLPPTASPLRLAVVTFVQTTRSSYDTPSLEWIHRRFALSFARIPVPTMLLMLMVRLRLV
jgi:hypothetical protein